MDDGKDAMFTLDRLLSRYGTAARYCIVKNLGRGKDFSLFDRSATRALAAEQGRPSWSCPSCTAPPCRRSIASTPASGPRSTTPPSASGAFTRMDRQRIKVWLNAVADQFGRLGDRV